MRSGTNCIISSGEVYGWVQKWVLHVRLLKDHGWECTAPVVLGIVLRAASRSISVSAACADLSQAPSDQAVMTALEDGLPKTLAVLERRLNESLTDRLPRRMRRRRWQVAIDWHLSPYYGEPMKSRNEIVRSKPKQGTSSFHAYASACIVQYGRRYTVALTWVRRHETMVVVLRRLIARIREIGLKIRRILADRAFFTAAVIAFFQQEELPFLMPVMFRGRPPKTGVKPTGLQWIKRQPAGWYAHAMKNGAKRKLDISVCVNYRHYRDRKTRKRKCQKLLFAAWRVCGSPTQIRELYRKRFGIETSFRQMRQARIYTCTRNPRLRLFFLAIALMLRNVWVWIHQTRLAEGTGEKIILHLERLRFKRMLDWIVHEIVVLMHDGTTPCVVLQI
jgi:hypothetical protein